MTNVNPSPFAFVTWKLKSVMKDCTFTSVLRNPLPASPVPPSVSRNRVPVMTALPFNVRPEDGNPFPKLTLEIVEVTMSVAVLLVTAPVELLTITSKVDPLSAAVVVAMAYLAALAPEIFAPFFRH
jgi:hypothetical protein